MLRNTASGYGLASRLLHWLLALAMFVLIGLGWYVVEAGYYNSNYAWMLNWHQSVGIVLWVVVVAMLAWHQFTGRPDPVASLHAWERLASSASKVLLYLAMLLIPLSGYIMSAAEDGGVRMFDLLPLPDLPGGARPWAAPALTFHVWASYFTLGLALLHGAGALKHHFVDRNTVLKRMLSQY